MQITLIQSELEAAIRQYVHDIVNIKEGMEINIELRAGRGVDGYTASIDIVKKGTVVTPRGGLLMTRTKEETKKDVPQTSEEKHEASVEEVPSAAVVASDTSAVEVQVEKDGYAQSVEEAPAAPAPKKSIFANL